MVSEAIAAGDVQAINYFVAQKYTEALTAIGSASNSKIVLMPIEASSILGSLSGIGAIAREVFGDGGNPPVSPAPPRTAPGSAPRDDAAGQPVQSEFGALIHAVEAVTSELGPWSWWVIGLVLLAAEMIVPGFFLVWIGWRRSPSAPCRCSSGMPPSGSGSCRRSCSPPRGRRHLHRPQDHPDQW
jgi:hypothetical protein